MADRNAIGRSTPSRGCLATGIAAAALTLLSPFVLLVQGWRRWRRGSEVTKKIHAAALTNQAGTELRRIDLELDVPQPVEREFRRRFTDTVIRVAETLRAADDVYHLVYRLPWGEESVVLPVGPQLQELGERFSLVQSQGTMAGRTAVWLTLGREHALAEVVDPLAYDPEGEGEPDRLLSNSALRWSMATEWARVGPSLVMRIIVVVPARHARRVIELLNSLV